MESEKLRILRWAGYVARMDITYKELCDYTGHQVFGRTEKLRRLRMVGYVARVDITYKELYVYTGHLVS